MDKAQTIVQRLGSTERTIVMRSGSAAQYVPTGHLVYALGPTLLAVRFDLDRREVIGGPVPVIDQVARASATTQSGVVHAVMSPTGTLAYLPGDNGVAATGPKQLMLADIDGRTTALGFPQQWYIHPRFSPDGKQIAVATDDGREANIWVADLASGASLRLTSVSNLFDLDTRRPLRRSSRIATAIVRSTDARRRQRRRERLPRSRRRRNTTGVMAP